MCKMDESCMDPRCRRTSVLMVLALSTACIFMLSLSLLLLCSSLLLRRAATLVSAAKSSEIIGTPG